MAVYEVGDKASFKRINYENWHTNTDFWLQGKMRHLHDIWEPTGEVLADILLQTSTVGTGRLIDFGCGEGWLVRLLIEKQIDISYLGVDFNEYFVEHLSRRYVGDPRISFRRYDIEDSLPDELVDAARVAVNIFNFFEVPDISRAFRNVALSLKPGGILLIVSIDPIMQMLAVTENRDDLSKVLKAYEANPETLGYDKDIDVGDSRSGRIYKSLFYSSAFYVRLAKANGLSLFDYREVVKTANFVPQIYQFLLFRK